MARNFTQVINYFNSLEKDTIISKADYDEYCQEYRKAYRKEHNVKHLPFEEYLPTWEDIRNHANKLGMERVETFYTTTSSKYKVNDVIEMMKKGMSVEEIEQTVSTQVKVIKLKKI